MSFLNDFFVMKARQVNCDKRGRTGPGLDEVAVEEPLELLVDGHPVSVVMRTPGDDEELMLGFLVTEGIVKNEGEVDRIALDYGENKAIAFLKEGLKLDLEKLSRHMFSASSCGICGKATLEAVMSDHPRIADMNQRLSEVHLLSSLERMEAVQETFQITGGLHAVALFSLRGELLIMKEDIGRHNAVDKVIGSALLLGIDLKEAYLVVSGRVSFEIMQKTLAARIPCLAAVSAPSSLAVSFAKEGNVTLVAFMRPPSYNVYHVGSVFIDP